MGRLVVISNRLPAVDAKTPPSGGVVVALQATLSESGRLWVGWPGRSNEHAVFTASDLKVAGQISFVRTDLSHRDVAEYYDGFCNSVLWPLCHDRRDLVHEAPEETESYFRVNRMFALRLLPLLRDDDLIWVHDFHFMPLAEELRRIGVRNRIGFFLHVPWPSLDTLTPLQVHGRLLDALRRYDLVGLQTREDADNFSHAVNHVRISKDQAPTAASQRHFCASMTVQPPRVGVFPISIATKKIADSACESSRSIRLRKLQRRLGSQNLIVGVDRLDYSKGLERRVGAYERFLFANPAFLRRVMMLQIASKSHVRARGYEDLESGLTDAVRRVNTRFCTATWTPGCCVHRAISQWDLTGIYRLARVGLVTPLRDGMNLVAKEYVASQDEEDSGVLVLSKFAGASRELHQAILVDPYDQFEVAEAISRALIMPLEERQARHSSMMALLQERNISLWSRSFLSAVRGDEQREASGLVS